MSYKEILQPQFKLLFRIEWQGVAADFRDTIAAQVLAFNVDYVNKTAELIVEQPHIGGALHDFLFMVFNDTKKPIVIDSIPYDGKEVSPYRVRYTLRATSHEYSLDYRDTGIAQHVFNFDILSHRAIASDNED